MTTQDQENRVDSAGTAPLEQLLVSAARSTVKVKALVHATRAGDPQSALAVRKHIGGESNPFVLATMASVLGRAGTAQDAALLMPLLDHADSRVVANALQALYLQKVAVAPDRLAELAKREDARVRANALAILGRYNPEFVMERIASLASSSDAMTRAGIAYLLGEMPGHPPVLKRLFEMLEREERTGVVKQLAQSVTKHAVPERADAVIGHLFELKGRAQGGKVALVQMLLQEVGVELGMVEAEVHAIGARHLAVVKSPLAHKIVSQAIVVPKVTPAPTAPPRPAPRAPCPVDVHDHAPASAPELAPAARTAPPSEPEVEGDVEINASAIWGAPPPAPLAEAPSSTGHKTAHTTAGRKRPADLHAPASPTNFPIEVPSAPTPSRAPWVGAAALFLAAGVWLSSGSTPAETTLARSSEIRARPSVRMKTELPVRSTRVASPAAPAAGSSGSSAAGDVSVLWKEPGVAERLGPVGAAVDFEGTVSAVSPGRAVVFSGGRYYVVRGSELDRKPVGSRLHCRGRVQGIAMSGLIYVDAEA